MKKISSILDLWNSVKDGKDLDTYVLGDAPTEIWFANIEPRDYSETLNSDMTAIEKLRAIFK